MPGGNLAPVATFACADGQARRTGAGFGKDLYLHDKQVYASGLPLYWRPEDSHYIERLVLTAPAGILAAVEGKLSLYPAGSDLRQKPKAVYTTSVFEDLAALVVAGDTLLLTGMDWKVAGKGRAQDETQHAVGGIAALNLKSGKARWQQSLPAAPVSFGLALDREGRILVTLQDGQMVCLQGAE
jgi:hypothetical protein